MNRKYLLMIGLVVCVAAAGSTFLVEGSPEDGPTIAGTYVWFRTDAAQADPRQATCDAERPGDDCVELCKVMNNTGSLALGMFCCVNPGDIGDWDSLEECTLSVP